MKVDWLIVGAGFTGCTLAERIATVLDQKVLIVERRDHIGGNAYDHYDDNGVLVHRYGPHIFHTNSEVVWNYLSQFTGWRPYHHRVLALVQGQPVPVPFNLNSLYALFPPRYAERMEEALISHYGFGAKVPILKMRDDNSGLRELADFVYDNIFYGYTVKQWELTPEQLSPSVTGRIPFLIGRDDRYFQDTYQGIPANGYTQMFEKMITHKNIRVLLNTPLSEVVGEVAYERMIYSGAVDEFFGYEEGELPYRSLHFEMIHHETDRFQEVAQMNFPNDYDYTRITEFKHLTGQRTAGTTVAVEYPMRHIRDVTVPYYPIPREENKVIFSRYARRMQESAGRIWFAGRLADYKYYNMDQAVARSLSVFSKISKGTPTEMIA